MKLIPRMHSHLLKAGRQVVSGIIEENREGELIELGNKI